MVPRTCEGQPGMGNTPEKGHEAKKMTMCKVTHLYMAIMCTYCICITLLVNNYSYTITITP